MGWWGPGVFDGDPALDSYARLAAAAGLDRLVADDTGLPGPPVALLPPRWTDRQARTVGSRPTTIAAITAWGDMQDPAVWPDGCVAIQVAAATLLAAGAPVAGRLADLTDLACDLDLWAARSPARRHSIDQLRAALHHNGKDGPIRVGHRTIDEAFTLAKTHRQPTVNLPFG